MEKYAHALMSPFDKRAIGAQVPDLYSFPTLTQFVRQEFTVQGDSSGDFDCVVMPSLFQSILTGCPFGGVNFGSAVGGVIADSNWQILGSAAASGTAANCNIAGCTIPSSLQEKLESYRLVGWGVRLRCLTTTLDQAGRVICAATPIARDSLYAPTAIGAWNNSLRALDLPPVNTTGSPPIATGYMTTEMLNMPDSMETTVPLLSQNGGLEFHSKVIDPQASIFRPSSVIASSSLTQYGLSSGSSSYTPIMLAGGSGGTYNDKTYTLSGTSPSPIIAVGMTVYVGPYGNEFSIVGGTVSAVLYSAGSVLVTFATPITIAGGNPTVYAFASAGGILDPNYILNGGWTGLCIRGVGCKGASLANKFSVEVIYHLEGPPSISSSGAVTHGGQTQPFVDTRLHDEIINYANATNSFKFIGHESFNNGLAN